MKAKKARKYVIFDAKSQKSGSIDGRGKVWIWWQKNYWRQGVSWGDLKPGGSSLRDEISGEERKITIYDRPGLGLLVKEIREEQFQAVLVSARVLVFYYTGDFKIISILFLIFNFLPTPKVNGDQAKNQNAIFKWGLNMLIVQLDSRRWRQSGHEEESKWVYQVEN